MSNGWVFGLPPVPSGGAARNEANLAQRNENSWGQGIFGGGGFRNANPWTNQWMNQTGNEQNMLMQMLFGGGGAGGGQGLLSQYMNPMSQGGFMNQFLATAPALQGLTRTASDAETARASQLGQQGINNASSMFAGLGSKYSGANMLAGNQAMQQSMGDLSGKIASENFGLLNSLYGNTLSQYAGAQGAGLQNLFGLYGLNAGNLAGVANPMIMANPTAFDRITQLLGAAGSAAAGAGSLATGLSLL